jgi:hypothetical protein
MEGAVIGRGCRLTASARVGRGQLVDPDQVISGARRAVAPVPTSFPSRRSSPMHPSADLLATASN